MATATIDDIQELVEPEARASGLRHSGDASLESVERRRFQLWMVVLGILVAITLTLVLLSIGDDGKKSSWLASPLVGACVLVLILIFSAYVVEKEMALRRLTRLLIRQHVEVGQRVLSERVAELVKVNRMKTEFAATVSHELRTPLTSILGSVITLRNLELSEDEEEEFLDAIERQGRRLLRLIEEVLTAARLEQGVTSLSPQPVDLPELVRLVARDVEMARHPIEVIAPHSCEVVGDPDVLQQVLVNMIDNAYKHGAPPVRVVIERIDGQVLLSVIDSGPGVPLEDRERIFERFIRLDETGRRPGIGLGLPIVRDLLTASGGNVWLDDAPGGGAAFRVTLPSRAAHI